MPISDLLLYQQGLSCFIYASLLVGYLCFSVATFWYKLPQFFGDKLESFSQFSSIEVANSVTFFL